MLMPINNFATGGPLIRPDERETLDEMGEIVARYKLIEEPIKRLLARSRALSVDSIIQSDDIPGLVDGHALMGGESDRWEYTVAKAETNRTTKKFTALTGADAKTFEGVINPREQVPEEEHENMDCSQETPPLGFTSSGGELTRQPLPDGTPVWLRLFDPGDSEAEPPEEPIYMIVGLIGADNPACAWCPDEEEPPA